MSYYHSEVDSSSEEESTSLSDESYKSPKSTDESLKSSSRSYESDRHKGFEKYHDHSCKPHLIGSLVDFQWCVFLIYGYELDDVDYYDEECPVMEQVHWKKGFRLFSRFLKHQSGCDIGKFLSSKNHFDTVHDDTGCLRYTKDRKSRIHIHKKFHGDSQSMESEYGMSTMDVSVNEDLNFRAVITSYHGRFLIFLSEKRFPMFKRKMRLRFHGERTEYPSLTFTEDCNFVQGIFRNWRDKRCEYRKFRHVASSGFKMNFKPPTYANCKDGSKHKKVRESNTKVDGKQNDLPVDKMPPKGRTKHKKNVVRKRVLPQKKILPKTIKKKVIFKNAVKNIRKKVEEKPAKLAKENDNEEKQKLAPIGDRLGPDH